ncbi:MAG: hypothetical protein PUE84_09720 [Firmicutes bacterium]|nr:hypothetical protein [Bacillota bacterium]
MILTVEASSANANETGETVKENSNIKMSTGIVQRNFEVIMECLPFFLSFVCLLVFYHFGGFMSMTAYTFFLHSAVENCRIDPRVQRRKNAANNQKG